MPRTIRVVDQTRDGALRRLEIKRTVGGVGIEIEFLETDYDLGVPIATRVRIFTETDLTATQRTALQDAFNAIESRLKTLFYS